MFECLKLDFAKTTKRIGMKFGLEVAYISYFWLENINDFCKIAGENARRCQLLQEMQRVLEYLREVGTPRKACFDFLGIKKQGFKYETRRKKACLYLYLI